MEDLEIERKKLIEKARLEEAEMKAHPSRDKLERPLKKGEYIQASKRRRQQGNVEIKEEDYNGAIVRYKQALTNFSLIREELTEAEQEEVKEIKLACYLNLALCYLKNPGREIKVIQNCQEALALDPSNQKVGFFQFSQSNILCFCSKVFSGLLPKRFCVCKTERMGKG